MYQSKESRYDEGEVPCGRGGSGSVEPVAPGLDADTQQQVADALRLERFDPNHIPEDVMAALNDPLNSAEQMRARYRQRLNNLISRVSR